MTGYMRVYRSFISGEWLTDCAICDWNLPVYRETHAEAVEFADFHAAEHEAARCQHCGQSQPLAIGEHR